MTAQTPVYKRMRVLVASFFLQPAIILTIAGAIAGDIVLFLLLGLLVGTGTSAVSLAVWRLGKRELEQQGFRW